MTTKSAKHVLVRDSDLAKVGPALKRAAAQAKRLALQKGTPFYVWKGGRVVDLNKASAGTYLVRERKSCYGR
jgi:hypothetical protein